MTLIKRSVRASRIGATLGLAMIFAAVSNAGQEALAKSVNDALAEVNATKAQLAQTMQSLNTLLTTKPGGDLRPAYQAYISDVAKTKQAAATTRERAGQMNGDSATYFSSWKADNEKISNDDIRATSNKRLEQTQKDYQSSVESLEAAARAFSPFMSDLTDIQTALSNDLTAKGVMAAKGHVSKANHDHDQVQTEIDHAIQHLNNTRRDLMPIAGGGY